MPDRLEDEHREAFKTWKADPSPEGNLALLNHLQPTIDDAIRMHVGQSNPLLVSKARRMSLDAVRRYDPRQAGLRTHLIQQLQGLRRVNQQHSNVIRVPERVALDRNAVHKRTNELQATLGREPSDAELCEHMAIPMKRLLRARRASPGVSESTMESAGAGQVFGGVESLAKRHSLWHEIVYDSLEPIDQKIMEHALGHGGRKPVPNQEIARRLGRSPGLISQRKAKIQGMLDNELEV